MRQANFELLRILAMLMVMVMHYLLRTGTLPQDGAALASAAAAAAVITESVCIVAVNVYVLISGYFLSAAPFRMGRILQVIAQVLFYTLLIPPVLAALGLIPFAQLTDVYHLWNCLFPVQAGHYWFISAYVVVCLFAPLINTAVWQLEQKCFAQILAGLLLFFSVFKTVSPLRFATDRFGYDFGWLLCVYLIGAWIRRFGFVWLKNLRRSILVYLISVCLIAAGELLLLELSEKISAFTHYAAVMFHYNFLPCLTGAIGLFACFYHVQIPEGRSAKVIRFFSPAVLGVYLIHEHADVSAQWCSWVTELTGLKGPVIVVPAFLGCLLIDKLRCLLFDKIAVFVGNIRKNNAAKKAYTDKEGKAQ